MILEGLNQRIPLLLQIEVLEEQQQSLTQLIHTHHQISSISHLEDLIIKLKLGYLLNNNLVKLRMLMIRKDQLELISTNNESKVKDNH
jgi:ABC-type proline/glycine betaine transport system permease subunit